MITLTPEQAELLQRADQNADGLFEATITVAQQLQFIGAAVQHASGAMWITPYGRNAVHWHYR